MKMIPVYKVQRCDEIEDCVSVLHLSQSQCSILIWDLWNIFSFRGKTPARASPLDGPNRQQQMESRRGEMILSHFSRASLDLLHTKPRNWGLPQDPGWPFSKLIFYIYLIDLGFIEWIVAAKWGEQLSELSQSHSVRMVRLSTQHSLQSPRFCCINVVGWLVPGAGVSRGM